MIKRFINSIPAHLKFLTLIYLSGILIFTAFRILLFINEYNTFSNIQTDKNSLIFQAFFMGFRFDTVISGYIIIFPIVLLTIVSFFNFDKTIIYRSVSIYLLIGYIISFFICTADIPYYHRFSSRFSTAAFAWANTPGFVAKMIFQEFSYWGFIIPFLILSFIFLILVNMTKKRIIHSGEINKKTIHWSLNILFSIIALGFVFVGIRGRVSGKSPIRVGTAFFCNHPFINQLGLNPVFTLIRSALDDMKPEFQKFKLMDEKQAIANVKVFLNISDSANFNSPIARKALRDSAQNKKNVVLVIMESMSASKMGIFGNQKKLTPFLDSIAKNGYFFTNCYSSGIHTFTGLYSTIFGLPSILKHHPMQDVVTLQFAGLPNVLSQNGYHSMYFTTYDEQFDNIGPFLLANHIHRVIGQKDYPSSKIKSTLGVSDHYMFEFSIPILNQIPDKPFLAIFSTSSDHGPYIIPDDIPYKLKPNDKKTQIIEYADWSIGNFLKLASKEKWFTNTVFIFLADHGEPEGADLEMPLKYHHIPFIIYVPDKKHKPQIIDKIAGQIDVFPTIMGILNIPYINNTLGINLFKETRKNIFFTNDEKIGCLNENFLYIYDENQREILYKYKISNDLNNYLKDYQQSADSMKIYVNSMLQTTQWLIDNNKVGIQN